MRPPFLLLGYNAATSELSALTANERRSNRIDGKNPDRGGFQG